MGNWGTVSLRGSRSIFRYAKLLSVDHWIWNFYFILFVRNSHASSIIRPYYAIPHTEPQKYVNVNVQSQHEEK